MLGFPVEHTLSPVIQNAAFAAGGIDCVYLAFPVPREKLPEALSGVRALNFLGCNVTAPHKEVILPLLDDLSVTARRVGAVNTVVNDQGRLTGHNTDGDGFLQALREEHAYSVANRTVLVLGAGGAARAVTHACARAGAGRILIANRTAARAAALAEHLSGLGALAGHVVWRQKEDLVEAVAASDLVVQCTSCGMSPREGESPDFPFGALRPGTMAVDVIYNPLTTNFLYRAGEMGARTMNGTGMVLYQGALAFTLWTGQPAPVAVMREALSTALDGLQRRGR